MNKELSQTIELICEMANEKAKADAPNYRDAGPASTKTCEVCRFAKGSTCTKYDFRFSRGWTCDAWRPDIAKARARLQMLQEEQKDDQGRIKQAAYAHGPGGLLSPQGMGRGKKRTKPGGRSLGPSIKNPRVYEALRKRGVDKKRAAMISNGLLKRQESKAAPTKSERGQQYPASAYLVVGDPESPSTWHLPYKTPGGELDTRLMGAAAAALGPGFRGNKYAGPDKVQAVRKLRAAYRQLKRKPPARLKEVSLKRSRGEGERRAMFAKMGAGGSGGGGKGGATLYPKGPEGKRQKPTKAAVDAAYHKMRELTLRGRSAIRDADRKRIGKELRQAMRQYQKLKKALDSTQKEASTFTVFKDKSGAYRWVAISSNAFQDRDNEIVSTKALENAVKAADESGERGPLRWWHVPGADIGQTDFQMVHGRMLVEAGTFDSAQVALKVAKAAPNLQMSIGFRHSPTEPDREGVFHTIKIFERSLVPKGRAANKFTSLSVKGVNKMSKEKEKQLLELLGEDLAGEILANAANTQKSAESVGLAFKEASDDVEFEYLSPEDLAGLSAKEMRTYAEALEAFEEQEEHKDTLRDNLLDYLADVIETKVRQTKAASVQTTDDGAATLREVITVDEVFKAHEDLSEQVKELSGKVDEVLKMLLGRRKEHAEERDTLKGLKSGYDKLVLEVERTKDHLGDLAGEQPPAIKRGYRASQQAAPVEDAEATKAQQQQTGEDSGPFGSFVKMAEEMNHDGVTGPWGQGPKA